MVVASMIGSDAETREEPGWNRSGADGDVPIGGGPLFPADQGVGVDGGDEVVDHRDQACP